QGRFRDPRVARDVLVGAVFGSVWLVSISVTNALPTWVPFHGQTPIGPNFAALAGGRMLLSMFLDLPDQILIPTFAVFGGWFLLRLVLRRALPAAIALAVLSTLLSLGGENPLLETPTALLYGVLTAWLITRYGLLALLTAISSVCYAGFAAVTIAATHWRPDAATLGLIAGSGLIHVGYFFLLLRGYRVGDLSLVYPVARGTGPLLATGVAIAVYTLWDGWAVKRAGVPPLVFYWGGEVVRVLALSPLALRQPADMRALWRAQRWRVLGIALLSPLGYILIL